MMTRILLAFITLASLGLTSQLSGADRHYTTERRYYDESHRDYHQWNADEDRRWHSYQRERHRRERDWDRAPKREQREYWAWRHQR